MKKSNIITTGIVCGSLLLFGCTSPVSPANISRKLDYNLTTLTNVVNKLDTIENSYLSNPDIHPTTKTVSVPAPTTNKHVIAKISTKDFTLSLPTTNSYKNKIANIDTYNKTKTSQNKIDNSEKDSLTYRYNVHPVKYSPRYTNEQNNDNEDYLKNYINKVRTLYSITNDAIEANNELGRYKNNVITYCVEIKQLNEEIENGTFIPSTNQISALNNYIDDIKITIKRIKDCNGDLSNEVNNINNSNTSGITAGIDVINSNYLSVLNHIDTRISYLKNAITTLEQVKNLLQEAQNIINDNPTTLEEIDNETIINFTDDLENINENTIKTDNVETDNNIIEENYTNFDANTRNNEDSIMDNNINNENINSEQNLAEENIDSQLEYNDTNSDNSLNSTENSLSESTNETSNSYDITTSDNIQTESETETIANAQENFNNQESHSNIDTYLNTNNNLDTYKKEQQEDINTKNNYTNIENNNNGNIVDNLNNNIPLSPIANGNNYVNNGVVLPTDEDKINAPNGSFQNGIITQNNLNNGVNNGINGTRTGYASSNNYPYINGDINRTNKNVDTYGYNTMIDMINRGTVNNGINTLNITDNLKPSMVNGIATLELNEDNYINDLIDDCDICDDNIKTDEEL